MRGNYYWSLTWICKKTSDIVQFILWPPVCRTTRLKWLFVKCEKMSRCNVFYFNCLYENQPYVDVHSTSVPCYLIYFLNIVYNPMNTNSCYEHIFNQKELEKILKFLNLSTRVWFSRFFYPEPFRKKKLNLFKPFGLPFLDLRSCDEQPHTISSNSWTFT